MPVITSTGTELRTRPLDHSLLEMIWTRGETTRADLARQTGLSRSTVSEIIARLLATRLIMETGGGTSRGGRPPILLRFNDRAHVILGVDMGSSHVAVVLTDLHGKVLAHEHRSHPVRSDPEGTSRVIRELCDACLARHDDARRKLLAIGVAAPSPVDPLRPTVLPGLILPAWGGHGALESLQAVYGAPVYVDNDANLGALAEAWWGTGRGVPDFAYIKLGSGVGGGYIISGAVYRGATGVAGEIGHMIVEPDGRPCVCGNRGCLETRVSTGALMARVHELQSMHPDSPLANEPVTIDTLAAAARLHDPLARLVLEEAGLHLGSAIAAMVTLMNPGAVIIGGSLARLGDLLLNPTRSVIHSRSLVNSVAATSLRTSDLGRRATALGAATLVLEKAFQNPALFPAMSDGR